LPNEQIDQLVAIFWNGNSYSGLTGTPYETTEYIDAVKAGDSDAWSKTGRVGGVTPTINWGTYPPTLDMLTGANPYGLSEGDIGMSWVNGKLTAKSNGGHFTFNVITGQMTPVYKDSSTVPTAKSAVGYKGQSYLTVDKRNPANTIWAPVAWGRESEIIIPRSLTTTAAELYADPSLGTISQPNWIQQIYKSAHDKGHEIGNMTLDDMASNSGLPLQYWPAQNGDGFDPGVGKDTCFNEKVAIEKYIVWDNIGWEIDAGRTIKQATWAGAIKVGEDELKTHLNLSAAGGNLFGFYAPRGEVNSAMFFALKDQGYTYDCTLENGYELNRDATNMLWPYTTDNGNPNVWTQVNIGNISSVDSMPSGLWEIPSNCVIVPESIRQEVFDHKSYIDTNYDGPELMTFDDWVVDGAKIPANDYDMFVRWGMDKDQWVTTMVDNLEKRMNGTRAPFSYTAHTDFYTPMYDLVDLSDSPDGIGRCLKYNNWKTRLAAMEDYVTAAVGMGAKFKTGKEVIDYVRLLKSQGAVAQKSNALDTLIWTFNNGESASTTPNDTFTGEVLDATVSVAPGAEPYFTKSFPVGSIKTLSHISLSYKTNTAIKVGFEMEDGSRYVVTLNNSKREGMTASGTIPLSAFEKEDSIPSTSVLDPKKIVGLVIAPLAPECKNDGTYMERIENYNSIFSIRDFKLYSDSLSTDLVSTAGKKQLTSPSLKIRSFSPNSLQLNMNKAGMYNIDIYSVNGRCIYSGNAVQCTDAGAHIPLNGLSNGVYVVKIEGVTNKVKLTQRAIIQ